MKCHHEIKLVEHCPYCEQERRSRQSPSSACSGADAGQVDTTGNVANTVATVLVAMSIVNPIHKEMAEKVVSDVLKSSVSRRSSDALDFAISVLEKRRLVLSKRQGRYQSDRMPLVASMWRHKVDEVDMCINEFEKLKAESSRPEIQNENKDI